MSLVTPVASPVAKDHCVILLPGGPFHTVFVIVQTVLVENIAYSEYIVLIRDYAVLKTLHSL